MTLDYFEERKTAPLHFIARAENARYAAFYLSNCPDDIAKSLADTASYNGTPSIALHEAYLREAAIAIELALKATIASKMKAGSHIGGMPQHHKTPELWQVAGLKPPAPLDKIRLRTFQRIMEWSGKYPTPKTKQILDREVAEQDLQSLISPNPPEEGKLRFIKPVSMEWEHFNRLFETIIQEFYKLRRW